MLIAPINSQSVYALVWLPAALKVRVKMNCSFIQERKRERERERENYSHDDDSGGGGFFFNQEVQKRSLLLSLLSFSVSAA